MSVETNAKLGLAVFAVVAGLFSGRALADAYVWEGDGDNATGAGAPTPDLGEVLGGEGPFKFWTSANNWNPEAVPGLADTLTFGAPAVGGSTNVAWNTPISAASIIVNDAVNDYEFEAYGAGKLTLAAGGSITLGDNTAAIPFRSVIDLNGSASITGGAVSSSFNFTPATINFLTPGSTLTVASGNGSANAIGAVTGPGSFARATPAHGGALSFFGQSTYTGTTQITGVGNANIVKVDNPFPTTVLTLGASPSTVLGGAAGLNGLIRIDDGKSVTLGGLQVAPSVPGVSTANGINANSIAVRSTLTINASQYSAFSGRLGAAADPSRNMNFVKTGPAAFTFMTSANTYTGATSILGGTLEVESGNINLTSGITINGGRLMYASATALTRPTIVANGTIGGTGTIGTPISISANAIIAPGGDVNSLGVLSETNATQNYSSGLTFAPDGTYAFGVNASTNDLLTTNALTVSATNTNPFIIDIQDSGLTPGTLYSKTIATSTAAIGTFAADKFAVTGGGSGSVSLSGNSLVLDFTALQSIFWDIDGAATAGSGGASPSGAWNGAAVNFNTDPTGAGAGTTTAATTAAHNVTFGAGGDATGSYTVTLTGAQSAANVIIEEGAVTLMGGSLATSGFNVAAGASGAVDSVLSGGPAGVFTKSGAGTLTLSGVNTYTGTTIVNAGTLTATGSSALGATTGGLAVNNPNTGAGTDVVLNLATTAATTKGSLTGTIATPSSGTNTATINNGGQTLTINQTAGGNFQGVIAGAGGFVLGSLSTNTLILSGANTYTGGTTLSGGTLQIGAGGTTGSIVGDITNNAALVFNRSDNLTYAGATSGTGSLTKLSSGTLSLTGANTHSGGTTVSAGTLEIGAGGTTGSISGNITNDATVAFNRSDDLTYAGVISGAGFLTKLGTGTLTLTGANTHAAGTTVSGGTLQIGDGGTTGSITGTIANTAAVAFNRSDAVAFAGVISGSGSVTKLGAGTLTLSATNTYNGATTVNAGTLTATGTAGLGGATGALAVNNPNTGAGTSVVLNLSTTAATTKANLSGAIATPSIGTNTATINMGGQLFTINQTTNAAYAGDIAGAGGFTKTGAATLTLGGTNTYTGGTTVNAGTLIVNRLHGLADDGSGTPNPVSITAGTLQVRESSPTIASGHPGGNNAFVSRPGSTITIANNGGDIVSLNPATLTPRIYNGKLDLTNNDLVIDYSATSPIADIEDMIRAGRNGGNWLGNGITSSTAGSIAAAGAYTLGVIDNATPGITPFTTFSGQTVDTTTILVKFVHRSDINMDGVVTFSDSVRFNGNYSEGTPTRWVFGDLNYNGVSDFGDSVLFNGGYDEALASLPEPGSLSLLGLAALGVARRRRRQRA